MISFGGQYCSSGSLESQIGEISDQISVVLWEAGAKIEDLVKLVVFYKPRPNVDEAKLRELLSQSFESSQDIAITIVPVRQLTHPESSIEIEGFAMLGESGESLERLKITLDDLPSPGDSFCHGMRCGEFVFVSGQTAKNANGQVNFPCDLPNQNRQVLHNIDKILAALGADRKDIVKANTWRQMPPDTGQYHEAAQDRFEYFSEASPALTGITVPDVAGDDVLITIDVWAMCGPDNYRMQKQSIQPENHWDWSSPTTYSQGLRCGRYLFVGGQAALDQKGKVLYPYKVLDQTKTTMEYVYKVLQTGHGNFADVIKVKTLYTANTDTTAYRRSLEIQEQYFGKYKPAFTHIPIDALAYPGQVIEIEAIAILKN